MGRLASHGLAVALYTLEKRWETAWGDFAESVFVVPGYDVETCKRYAKVGRFLADVPRKPLKESFLERPISDLVAIAQARDEHGDFSLAQLQTLAGSSDNADLRKKLKQVTQRKERANGTLEIVLDSEGTLTAWQGGQGMAFGYLTPDLAANSLGQRARARLVKRARIQER